MKEIYCHKCGRKTQWKRELGIGTLIAVIITVGLWAIVIPFYPIRCRECGADSVSKEEQRDASPNVEENELPVQFLDRVIAFLLLILPFSMIITWGQEQLDGVMPQSIAHLGVLVGIIVILLAVGRLSKVVYGYRVKLCPR